VGCSHADDDGPGYVPIHDLHFSITVASRSRATIAIAPGYDSDPMSRLPVHQFDVRRVMSLDAVDANGHVLVRGLAQDELGGNPAAPSETIAFTFNPPLPPNPQPYTLVGMWLADRSVRVRVRVLVWPSSVVMLKRTLSGARRRLDNVIFTCMNARGRTNNAEMRRGATVRIDGLTRLANDVRFVPDDLHDRVGFVSFQGQPGLFVADPIVVSFHFNPRDAQALRPVIQHRPWMFREPCISGSIVFQNDAQLHAYL
jgi:hypothetical protein